MIAKILATAALKRAAKRAAKKLIEKTKGKLTYASVGALVIGLVSQQLNVDIAPAEVDVLVTAAATVGAIFGRWRATRG